MTSNLLECKNFLNNYNIEKKIGSGGMGEIFLAVDKRLDRYVAVKTLKLPGDSKITHEEFVERFRREAKAVARLSHPNIVSIYDIGEENGQYYMVMEYIEGHNLEQFLKASAIISFELSVIIALQLCNALEYAHNNNIIHRDVKPDNVILTGSNNVKLTDFGIAHFSADSQKLTQVGGSMLGSIAYISPEQLVNPGAIDHRADIYSLGATIYEILTGNLLFEVDNVATLITKIMTEKPVSISSVNKQVPESFSLIIDKCLEKDPEKRFKSAGEIIKELSKFASKETFFSLPIQTNGNGSDRRQTGDLVNEPSRNTKTLNKILRRTGLSTTNKNLTEYLSANNYLWVSLLMNTFKSVDTELTFSQLKQKIRERDINGNLFSGVIVLNNENFLFVYEGYFVGTLNVSRLTSGEKVFESLPVLKSKIILKPMNEESNKEIPLLLAGIINMNGESIHENLDSSLIELSAVIEKLTSPEENFTGYITLRKLDEEENEAEKNRSMIYIYAYSGSKQIFSFIVGDNTIPQLTDTSIENVLESGSFMVNVTRPKFEPLSDDLRFFLGTSETIVTYNDINEPKLEDALQFKDKEIPGFIISALKENLFLDVKSSFPNKINVMGKPVLILPYVYKNNWYNFCNWLCTEFFPSVNTSNNINAFRNTFSNIPLISYFRFNQNIENESGLNCNFTWVAYDNKGNIIFTGRFGEDNELDLESFIEDCISIKKQQKNKSKSLYGAFYISKSVSSQLINYCSQNTSDKGILSKEKSIVKTSFGEGFQLILIKENENTFDVVVPK